VITVPFGWFVVMARTARVERDRTNHLTAARAGVRMMPAASQQGMGGQQSGGKAGPNSVHITQIPSF
jgi:hypothetical protein